jgi:hypothetical protein
MTIKVYYYLLFNITIIKFLTFLLLLLLFYEDKGAGLSAAAESFKWFFYWVSHTWTHQVSSFFLLFCIFKKAIQ